MIDVKIQKNTDRSRVLAREVGFDIGGRCASSVFRSICGEQSMGPIRRILAC